MRKAMLPYLCAVVLLTCVAVGLSFSLAKTNVRVVHANAVGGTQGTGMMWNATDCNATFAPGAYSGPQTLSPRIAVEYGDDVVKKVLTPPQGMNKTIAPRIAVEYEDCLVTIRTRIAYDVNVDGKCNMKDVGLVAKAYGLTANSTKWNQALDLNGDFKVDMKDVAPVAKHYGEVYT